MIVIRYDREYMCIVQQREPACTPIEQLSEFFWYGNMNMLACTYII